MSACRRTNRRGAPLSGVPFTRRPPSVTIVRFSSRSGTPYGVPLYARASRSQYSSVAQWQSIRLLTGGLLVRVQPEEPNQSRKSPLDCNEVHAVRCQRGRSCRMGALRLRGSRTQRAGRHRATTSGNHRRWPADDALSPRIARYAGGRGERADRARAAIHRRAFLTCLASGRHRSGTIASRCGFGDSRTAISRTARHRGGGTAVVSTAVRR